MTEPPEAEPIVAAHSESRKAETPQGTNEMLKAVQRREATAHTEQPPSDVGHIRSTRATTASLTKASLYPCLFHAFRGSGQEFYRVKRRIPTPGSAVIF